VVKVVDFGISKLAEVDSLGTTTPAFAMTRTGAILGTPYYMSPEQARGRRDIDARSDIYSAGAVLFHALTGRPPYLADNYNALIAQILMDDPPALCALRPDVPQSLGGVVARAMAKRPEDRFGSVAEFALVLQRQTRVLSDVAVLFTDLDGFSAFALEAPLEDVELLLEEWERVHASVASKHGGALRTVMADAMLLTFPSVEQAVRAWLELLDPSSYTPSVRERIRFRSGLARGDVRIVRSAIFGRALNLGSRLSTRGPAGGLALPQALFDALPPGLREGLHAVTSEDPEVPVVSVTRVQRA
jgi:class 3 adenylate cyclase